MNQISVILPKKIVTPSKRIPNKDIDHWEKKGKTDKLIEALGYWEVRADAAEALGRLGNPEAVVPLTSCLEDRFRNVRSNAARALGEIGDPRAVEALIPCLKDRKSDVRADAAWALGRIGDKRAVEPLSSCLSDKDTEVYRNAAVALGEIGDPRAIEPLIARLKEKDKFQSSSAADALVKIGTPAVLPLMNHLKDRNKDFCKHVIWTLGEIGDTRAEELITPLLESKDLWLRTSAEEAIGKLGPPHMLEEKNDN